VAKSQSVLMQRGFINITTCARCM